MRKVLSFVLVLALVLGSFSMVFGASYSDMAGEKSSDAVKVLSGLGVISGYPDGTYKPDRIVTRAEMAKLIVAGLGLEKFATATTSKYPDMTAAPWAQGYVAYGTSLGFISGYPDGTFKPNNTVSYEEAASMIVRALGYTSEFLPGDWPAEWMIKAQSLGLFKNVVNKTGGANRGDIAIMLYNALDEEIGYVDADNKWNAGEGDDNMLIRLGAEKADAAVITGEEDTAINLRAYVGAYAETYWLDDEIIAVVEKSVFITGEFDGDVMDGSYPRTISAGAVFEADKDYTLKSDAEYPDIVFFENGENVAPSSFDWVDDGDTYIMAVKLSGLKIETIYSISEWIIDDAFLYDEDLADEVSDDQTLAGYEFVLDDNDDIDMLAFDLVGIDGLDDLDEDNVVYVYANSSDEITKIEVGTEIVSGSISKITSGGDYTISGKVYEQADASVDFGATFEGSVGDSVDAYLDVNGDIFKMVITDGTADDFAIVLETGDGTGSLSGYDPAIKLFLADGTNKVFDVDSDEINDMDIIDDYTWSTTWAGVSFAGMIVEYGVDKDGVIDTLVEQDILDGDDDITAKGYYEGYKIASDAVIFTYDGTNPAKASNYGVTTLAKVLDTDDVVSDYILDGSIIVAMLIYDYDTTDSVYGVVTDWAETDTDAGYEFTFLVDGKEVVYGATSAAYVDFDGDYDELFEIFFNAKGEVDELVVVDVYQYLSEPVRDGYVLEEYTLDSDVVIYEWSASAGNYKVGYLRDLNGAYDVYMYDTIDAVNVYDIVLFDADGNWD